MYEVELKFRLADEVAIITQLAALGAVAGEQVEQCDLYLNHPQRDFAQTDEALRIRRDGSQNVSTYKGPRVDSQTKTRREIEISLLACARAGEPGSRIANAAMVTAPARHDVVFIVHLLRRSR